MMHKSSLKFSNRPYGLIGVFFWIEILSLAALFLLKDLKGARGENLFFFLAGQAAAFAGYAYLLFSGKKTPAGALPIVLLGAVLFRLTLFWMPPSLSSDLYRYLWDGRVQQAGINPYRYAPAAPEVAHLADEYHPLLNHPEIPTIYPPLSQLVFWITDTFAHDPKAMKIPFLLADLGILLLLLWILPGRGIPRERVVVYAWNPLILVEYAGSGHNDSLAIFLLLAALILFEKDRPVWGTIVLALSFHAKLLALLFLPFARKTLGQEHKKFRSVGIWLLFLFCALLLFLPYRDAGKDLFQGFFAYATLLRFNDSLFFLLERAVAWIVSDGEISLKVAKWVSAAAVAGVALFLYLRGIFSQGEEGGKNLFKTVAILIATLLLFTTQLHPWYLGWILPFCLLFPKLRGFLLFSATVSLSYIVYIAWERDGIWHEPLWLRGVEFLPPYLLLLWDLIVAPLLQKVKMKLKQRTI